jgi:hypothetical protein
MQDQRFGAFGAFVNSNGAAHRPSDQDLTDMYTGELKIMPQTDMLLRHDCMTM